MKKTILSILILLVCVWQPLGARVTLIATAGDFQDSLLDQSGNEMPEGVATALIVDTTGGDFSSFSLSSGTFTADTAIGTGIYIVDIRSSQRLGSTTVSQYSVSFDIANHPGLSTGDSFAILWFPEIAFSDSFDFVSGEDFYGLTREGAWKLPVDGGTFTSGSEGPAPGGRASFGPFAVDDIDADGMSNAFELEHFGSETAGNPLADNDADGQTNLSEFLARTDPTDRSSVFMTSIVHDTSGVQISVTTVPGRSYTFLASSDLVTFTSVSDPILATGESLTFSDSEISVRRFYKVAVSFE